ncbi:hypothetical protein [Shimia ponticola]|uniref:hypothetical protein n=1 Tax=Shimia ponticola TaxID=2582893 RepID=UPI0011BEAB16|nr:hypothetical protein [Shimia ponticola]
MSSALFITAICGAIIALLLARTLYVLRQEKGQKIRGSEPGTGHHTIYAEYYSGFSGHSTSYEIPRDPQAYARLFVPAQSTPSDKDTDK